MKTKQNNSCVPERPAGTPASDKGGQTLVLRAKWPLKEGLERSSQSGLIHDSVDHIRSDPIGKVISCDKCGNTAHNV